MLINHVAIVRHFERLSFAREAHEKRFEMGILHIDALTRFPDPTIIGVWTARIKPNHGPLMVCFNRRDAAASIASSSASSGASSSSSASAGANTPQSSYVGGNLPVQRLRFSRNFIVHCRDYREDVSLFYNLSYCSSVLIVSNFIFCAGQPTNTIHG